jgi:outer membrane protein assembly factor BamB
MRTILGWIATSMLCSAVLVTAACSPPPPSPRDEWYTYRYDSTRTGAQPWASDLSDPAKVGRLAVKWSFPRDGQVDGFKASPIVVNDTVFIGSTGGYFYAIDAATGKPKWQYPKTSDPGLLGSCNDFGRYGIQSSATYASIGGQDAVIFGAPDPSAEGGFGSARLFAFTLSGDPIWKSTTGGPVDGKSDIVAHVSGCIIGNAGEHHERIAYSSPLVLGDKIYVGVHDTGDNPLQVGRVIAVDLATGHIDPSFHFQAVGTPASPDPQCTRRCEEQYEACLNCDRSQPGCPLPSECAEGRTRCEAACRQPTTVRGGGVWNSMATDGAGVYFTTGNTRVPWCRWPYNNCPNAPEPSPNHGLSMIRVDKDSGSIIWATQPVPFRFDGDPDWAAGATIMSTSCGELIASVQKDGWSYAVNAGNGIPGALSRRWQFPPTEDPFTNPTYVHGDDDYKRPGAAWNDVLIITTGGESLVHDTVTAGYGKLHALNACATTENDRVRWIAGIPNSSGGGYSLGVPTVTGGIVFIGTDLGHLVVLGDPRVVPAVGVQCSNPDYNTSPADCTKFGFNPTTRIPKVLADVPMPDGGDIAGLRREPALAKGRVFVGTLNGHVYMLDTTTDTHAGEHPPKPAGTPPQPSCAAECGNDPNPKVCECYCQNERQHIKRICEEF